MQTADEMVAAHGPRAYDTAVKAAAVATRLCDLAAADHFAQVARELLARGLHKEATDGREARNRGQDR